MKKSYDYFKTLKLLSELLSGIYKKTLLKQDFSSERIHFLAEKSELINNLQNEFITPLERGDIFFLEESLSEELDSVLSLNEYLSLVNNNFSDNLDKISIVLNHQMMIFSQLKSFKSNIKLFEQCSEEIKLLNNEKKCIEKKIIDVLNCKSEQPLVKYTAYSACLDLNRRLYKTILQIERILINNS